MSAYQTVAGDLHSFFYEIARFSKTTGPHYRVYSKRSRRPRYYYVIEHHNGRWKVYMESIFDEIKIKTTNGDTLVVDRNNRIYLNGRPLEEVCVPGYRCFTGKAIRDRVAVAWWLWQLWEHGIVRNVEELAKIAETLLGEPP